MAKLSPFDQIKEKEKMLDFYIMATKQLQRRLPIYSSILLNASCLHPMVRSKPYTRDMVERLANVWQHVVNEIEDEWKIYMSEKCSNVPPGEGRIDHYWRAIFETKTMSGENKYIMLPPLVKAILSLQNGNSAVERSLSDNNNLVTGERTGIMHETIVGLRLIKQHARIAGGAHYVNITDEMKDGMKEACRLNQKRMNEGKEKKEKERKRKRRKRKRRKRKRKRRKLQKKQNLRKSKPEIDYK